MKSIKKPMPAFFKRKTDDNKKDSQSKSKGLDVGPSSKFRGKRGV